MKVSELISKLEVLKSEHGDMRCVINGDADGAWMLGNVSTTEYSADYGWLEVEELKYGELHVRLS